MIGRCNDLIIVTFSIKWTYCGKSHIRDWYSSEVQFTEGTQILGRIDEFLLAFSFEESEMLLLCLVHVSLLVECDVAQLFLVDKAFAYGLADDVVNDLV